MYRPRVLQLLFSFFVGVFVGVPAMAVPSVAPPTGGAAVSSTAAVTADTALTQGGTSAGEEGRLPSVPVLTVSAGILPTSALYALDRADEWVQRNVFTFGVRRLRASSELAHASERVAELQVLDDQGLRTPAVTEALLRDHRRALEHAARVVGDEYARGGRPVALTVAVVRTTLASVDALELLFAQEEVLSIAALREGEDLDAAVSFPARDVTPALDDIEVRVFSELFPSLAIVPEQVLRLAASEQLARQYRALERTASILRGSPQPAHVRVAAAEVFAAAQNALLQGRQHFAARQYREVFTFTREARTLHRWLRGSALLVPIGGQGENSVQHHIERILQQLASRGLLEQEELASARESAAEDVAARSRGQPPAPYPNATP